MTDFDLTEKIVLRSSGWKLEWDKQMKNEAQIFKRETTQALEWFVYGCGAFSHTRCFEVINGIYSKRYETVVSVQKLLGKVFLACRR